MARNSGLFYVTGWMELDATLSAMPLTLQKKGVRKATRVVAKMVLEQARKWVPVETGKLRRSLTVRAQKRSRKKQLQHDVGHLVITRDGMFQGDTFYGGFLEFGTKERATAAGQGRGRIREGEFDYLRRSLFTNQGAKVQVFIQTLQAWLYEVRIK